MSYWRNLRRAICGLPPEGEAGVDYWRAVCARAEMQTAKAMEKFRVYHNECASAHKGIARLKRKIKQLEHLK